MNIRWFTGWALSGTPTATGGEEAGKRFVANKPPLDEVNRQWGAASYLNDEYDRAWKEVVRPYRDNLKW